MALNNRQFASSVLCYPLVPLRDVFLYPIVQNSFKGDLELPTYYR